MKFDSAPFYSSAASIFANVSRTRDSSDGERKYQPVVDCIRRLNASADGHGRHQHQNDEYLVHQSVLPATRAREISPPTCSSNGTERLSPIT